MNASLFGTQVTAEPQNDFKPFAVGEKANVIEQSEYEKAAFLKDGFREGIARSSEINKAIRQGSSIATALARFAAAKTGEDILDNGDIDLLSRQIERAIGSVSSLLLAKARGTPDAIVAGFTPAVRELKDGLLVHVRAEGVNTITVPTFKADETGAKAIVKGNNLPLAIGDIAGAGHWLEMQYDGELDKWILQNPAKGVTPQSGVPVGTIEYFATTTPPAGYLKADGAAVGRETYPELFAAIGTTFGEGDGETTFNLPDLIDRFAQGSATPGQKIEAGLPDAGGFTGIRATDSASVPKPTGIFFKDGIQRTLGQWNGNYTDGNGISALLSKSSPIYGASDTVQPPALTLLPCIKAFDAATNPGLIDITELANDVAKKADCDFSNVTQTAIDTSIKWSLPDWSAPVDITNSFGAKGNSYIFQMSGAIVVTSYDNGYVYLSVNENDVIRSGTNIVASDSAVGVAYATITPVYKNLKLYVTLTSSSNFKVIFYPLAGTQ